MTNLVLYDDAIARGFEPFALTRPFGEMRAGIALVRARWEGAMGSPATGALVAEQLRDFEEPSAPRAVREAREGAIVANTRCIVPLGWSAQDADVWTCDGQIAAVRLGAAVRDDALNYGAVALEELKAAGARVVDIPGRWIGAVWELITSLLPQLREDIDGAGPQLSCAMPDGAIVLGRERVFVEHGAIVEPQVVFDATNGPVLVRAGAQVRAFTRLVGPCADGSGAARADDERVAVRRSGAAGARPRRARAQCRAPCRGQAPSQIARFRRRSGRGRTFRTGVAARRPVDLRRRRSP